MVLVANTRRENGFSLVELMVSMVLGLMLIAGAVSIYLATDISEGDSLPLGGYQQGAPFIRF